MGVFVTDLVKKKKKKKKKKLNALTPSLSHTQSATMSWCAVVRGRTQKNMH